MNRLSSIDKLKKKYNLTNKQLLIILRKCVYHYLSEEEFVIFVPERKLKK